MKWTIKKFSVIFFMMVLCVGTVIFPTSARSSWYLNSYRAWLNADSGGKMSVTVDVQATDYMDTIGATRIEILESKNNGTSWTSYRVFLSVVFPEMLESNDFLYFDTPVSFTGTPGYKYCAIVTVYARDSTGSDSREYTTPMVTAKN